MIRLLFAAMLTVLAPTLLAAPLAFQHVAVARIVATARAQIDARLGNERDAAHVTVVGAPEEVAVPPGIVTLGLRVPGGHWPRARVGVPVDISVDGRVVQSATVWFAVEVRRPVLSYATDAPTGTSAASLKLAPLDTDVARLQGVLVADKHDVDGMRLRHPVLAGSVAVREDFESVPDVDPKERVRVMVAFGSIQMQAKGTAITKGNTGDIVPVLVDNAEAPVRARITEKGVVEVVQ